MPKTTRPSGQALSGERQLGVSGNALDHSPIRAGPTVVRDREQSVAIPQTTQPSGQALSGDRQIAVSGNTPDRSAIGAGPQCEWWQTASSQWHARSSQKQLDNFDDIFLKTATLLSNLLEKCISEHFQFLSFICFVELFSISKLLTEVV